MDWHDIARLRSPDFTIARRGYDKHEVDKFLEQLVDWLETDAAQDIGEVAVTRKLELVGKSTADILLTTEQEAQELKRQSEEDCAELRAQAEADAQTLRANADDDARRAREEAKAEATETIEEGLRRRGQIDHQIRDLEDHRAAVLEDLGRLRAELSVTIDAHPPTPAKQNGEPDRNAPTPSPPSRAKRSVAGHLDAARAKRRALARLGVVCVAPSAITRGGPMPLRDASTTRAPWSAAHAKAAAMSHARPLPDASRARSGTMPRLAPRR